MGNGEEQRWHWGEATKYATEAMKALLAINGGSAVAVLAFWGTARASIKADHLGFVSQQIGKALFAFGIGALISVAVMLLGYLTQLQYGNRPPNQLKKASATAVTLHYLTYTFILIAMYLFYRGISKASLALSFA